MAASCPHCSRPLEGAGPSCPHCGGRLETSPGDKALTRELGLPGRFLAIATRGSLGVTRLVQAWDRNDEREVTLRVLPEGFGRDEDAVDRIRTLVRRHEALVGVDGLRPVRSLDPGADGAMFLVYDPLPATTLKDRLRKDGPLDTDAVKDLGIRLAGLLATLHAADLAHEELRLESVLLDDDGGLVLTGIGTDRILAAFTRKAMGGGEPESTFWRSPEYRKRGLPDARADLFALGCLLLQAATGARGFTPDYDAHAEGGIEAGDPFPDPISPDTKLDPLLRSVIHGLLAPHPDDRFRDGDAVAAALRGAPFDTVAVLAAGAATETPKPAAFPPGDAPAHPRSSRSAGGDGSGRGGFLVGALIAVVVLGGGGFVAWRAMGNRAAEEPAGPTKPTWTRVAPLRLGLPALPPPPTRAWPERFEVADGRLWCLTDGAEMVVVQGAGKPFLLDRHEVTVGQYRAFCGATGWPMPSQPPGSTDAHPVVNLTWEDADTYAQWTGKRLPTAAEWEAAARGPGGAPRPWGVDDDPARRNFPGADDGHAGLAPAAALPGSAAPNGAVNLLGNAWEWCAGSVGPDGGLRPVKGGSWKLGGPPVDAAVSQPVEPDVAWPDLGFRCAADLR